MKCVEFKVHTKPWDRVRGLIEKFSPGGYGQEVWRIQKGFRGEREQVKVHLRGLW